MNDALKIFGIAALVAVAFIVAWLVAVLRDGRRLRGMRHISGPRISPETMRRIVERYEKEVERDDDTRAYPASDVPGREP